MSKKGNAIALSLVATVMLAGCSSSPAENQPQGSGAAAGGSAAKTKITYWTNDRSDADYIKQVIQKFNETNKDNLEVELTVMADNYDQSVDISFASKQAPDILRVDFNKVVPWVKKGFLTPLDPYISEDMKAKFTSTFAEEKNIYEGKIYSLPNVGQIWRLVYNVDLFEKAGIKSPPTTLQELVDTAKKLTEAGKSTGAYGFAGSFKSSSAFDRVAYPIATLSGTNVVEGYNLKTGQYDFGAYKETVEALRQMRLDGSMLPGSEALDIDPLRAQFAQGKIGMYVNHSAEPAVYNTQFPAQIKWASAPVPTIDGNKKGASLVNGGAYLSISAESDKKDKAWKFIEYMYSDEVQTGYHEKGYGVSILPHITANAKQGELPGMEGFVPTAFDAIYPAAPTYTVEGKVEGVKKSDAFTKYMIQGGDLDQVIADLNTRYNAALDKVKAAGDTKAKADPSFDSAKLQGTLGK
ncbi:ABC transporter substrate-binding protein [Paenibacillus puerhi]|uniref:ABC transporter substrate-binding protein n=1 Tax=Paenibacillus puerhi TaxID=2692622 RepID=UPI001F1BEA68|nr:sugar ABC transporter substrate-binding protein [Paenibacillus puerhi]